MRVDNTPLSGALEVAFNGDSPIVVSQHSVKILLQALCTISPVKIFIKEKYYSTVLQGAASSPPDHGCHKTYNIEGKFKYITRMEVQTY